MASLHACTPAGIASLRKRPASSGFVLFLAFLAFSGMAAPPVRAQSPQQQRVYASGGTAVYGFTKDATTGNLAPAPGSPYNERIGGHALAIDPLGRFLSVLNPNANNVSVFAIDQLSGALTEVTGSPFSAADAVMPQVLAAGPSGNFLYVGNYQAASSAVGLIDIYSIDSNTGALKSAAVSPVLVPLNPTAMVIDPKGRFFYSNAGFNSQTGDPGAGVYGYQIDPVTGALVSPGSSCSSGQTGRSLGMDPRARFLFVGRGQLQGFIDSCTISPLDGSLQLTGTYTIPQTAIFPDAMAVDSSGNFLYVVTSLGAVRAFSVDQTTGVLTELLTSPLQGITLGNSVVADPQGPFVYALGGTGLLGFRADPATGALTQIGSVATAGSLAVPISGTPVQPVSGPVATLVPNTPLDFGSVTVGTTGNTTVIHVVNTGGQSFGFSSISISGANNGDFSQTNTCTAPLAPNQNCSISITFSPSAAGTRSATLNISDTAPGSPQTLPLTGQGVAPQPAVTLMPGSLTFPDTVQGNSSPAQTATLTNSGQATLTIASIAVGGTNPSDFAQANNCASVAPSASCSIHVTFTPLAAGQRTASVTITDNAIGSPRTIPLSGTGDAPFSIGTSGNNPTSVTINAGQTAQFLLQLAPNPAFTGTVTIACAGAPALANCQVNPSTMQFPGGSAAAIPFTVSVATTARSSAAPSSRIRIRWPLGGGRLILVAFAALAILWMCEVRMRGERARRLAWSRAAVVFALLVFTGSSGCGGGSASPAAQPQPPPPAGTPAGTSTLTLTAVSGNLSIQFQLTLTVK